MADLAGRLQIALHRTPEGPVVDIRSSRPVSASRVFVGRGVMETSAGLPALFSICSIAQAAASVAACEQALGRTAPPETASLRGNLVDAETVREHLWRLLLDWPKFLGAGPNGPAMARVMAAFGRLRAALSNGADLMRPGASDPLPDLASALACLDELTAVSAAHLFDQTPAAWLERIASADRLRAWAQDTDTVAARMLRDVDSRGWGAYGHSQVRGLPSVLAAAELESRLGGAGAENFVASPVWGDAPAESSPYSRNRGHPLVADLNADYGNGLLPRFAALLVELASQVVELRRGIDAMNSHASWPPRAPDRGPQDGVGIAQVQAARGLLVHRVALEGERVADYRILAPTEWNFHPQGVVATGLAAMPDTDDESLLRMAKLFITAVDPCVDYAVTTCRTGSGSGPGSEKVWE